MSPSNSLWTWKYLSCNTCTWLSFHLWKIEKCMSYEVYSKKRILSKISRVRRMYWRYLLFEDHIVTLLIYYWLFYQDISTLNHCHSDPRSEIDDIGHLKSVNQGKYLLVDLNEPSKKEVSPSTRDGTCVCDNTCRLYPECCCDWLKFRLN